MSEFIELMFDLKMYAERFGFVIALAEDACILTRDDQVVIIKEENMLKTLEHAREYFISLDMES